MKIATASLLVAMSAMCTITMAHKHEYGCCDEATNQCIPKNYPNVRGDCPSKHPCNKRNICRVRRSDVMKWGLHGHVITSHVTCDGSWVQGPPESHRNEWRVCGEGSKTQELKDAEKEEKKKQKEEEKKNKKDWELYGIPPRK
ncbi:hypothetical protein B9Z65_6399 [Elsinoe australis]|uniref:Secreted protein n=1 Tax=Elsinoe australis TaxID=40998 RepID=A0A2P8A8I2_9PEZI|nr:hypothetical protein B9Z65_6399 [Elsinoe australis]